MDALSYGCNTDGRPCRHGPPPTLVYVSHIRPEEAERLANNCRNYAKVRAWSVIETVIEETPDRALNAREGWKKVVATLKAGSGEIIVVPGPASVDTDVPGFEALKSEFRSHDAVLVAAFDGPEPPPVPVRRTRAR
ncbi:recombinase family protein [Streptomyces eurocidicus]|nr:recombinase family protein [Streptomyces eurocidicus]MBB5121358.1 hypothetical protein [Streptomyces eurocidicus]MBF6055960.1 hypothetical protein [Streptomyces eurocidicus]